MIESQRKFSFLHVEYEIRRLLPRDRKSSVDSDSGESQHAIMEHEFSKLAQVDVSRDKAKRRSARPYLYLADQKCGLGLILLLGAQSRKQ